MSSVNNNDRYRSDPIAHLTREVITERMKSFEHVVAAPGARRAAAVAIPIVEVDGVRGIWITKRAPTLRAHSGQWALPGGRIDEGETPQQAALRELEEEIGVSARPADILGRLDDYVTRSGYAMTPIVVWIGEAPEVKLSAAEVARLHFIPFPQLDVEPRLLTIPESDRPVIQMPLLSSLIHAPTAAVLYQFREVALQGRPTRVSHFEQPVFAWK
ncbi:mutator protein MutT [Antricoccus suffuscus]|uniref:Mutator protein MutT n=1 Tax=Antricoccus suffuscus TaxID=1629062 RepID=A0A2T0ZZY2_9ACTN|nr:CoA pyrophosphatase [Antricoccus suffuscus]PRZ41900.1 mutator protein MutT [Antricoccus suffuscus]